MLTIEKLALITGSLDRVLREKNVRYGDSALNGLELFSSFIDDDTPNTDKKLLVRLDDKINRIYNASELRKNDIFDLMGYLCLYCASRDWVDFSDQLD